MSRRVAAVVLVDRRGWLLLQERDENAPVNPDQWSLVGGAVEDGESDHEAAVRELAEETEVAGVELSHVDTFSYFCDDCGEGHDLALYLALTDLTDREVVCHEGRQIVFVDPRTIHTLRWGRNLVHALPRIIGHPAYVERFGRSEPHGFGCVLLVDAQGRVLLQERDEHAPVAPNQWGLVGGHVEPGEGWEEAMRRELAEETGLTGVDGAELWFDEVIRHSPKVSSHLADHWRIWAAAADLTDDDIVLGEGRQIVFVDPQRLPAGRLDLAAGARHVLAMFLRSATYARLRAGR